MKNSNDIIQWIPITKKLIIGGDWILKKLRWYYSINSYNWKTYNWNRFK